MYNLIEIQSLLRQQREICIKSLEKDAQVIECRENEKYIHLSDAGYAILNAPSPELPTLAEKYADNGELIQANRLLGEFIGTLEGVCLWEIPEELKSKLQTKLTALLENEKSRNQNEGNG